MELLHFILLMQSVELNTCEAFNRPAYVQTLQAEAPETLAAPIRWHFVPFTGGYERAAYKFAIKGNWATPSPDNGEDKLCPLVFPL